MSTSAVYSPHPPTPNPLPTTTPDSASSSVTKSRFARGRSAGATPNGSSVSPTRPVTASGPVSTRSRRSQTSKEPSPEKMSTSEVLVPNDDSLEGPVHNEISKSLTTGTAQDDGQQQVESPGAEGDINSAPIVSTLAAVDHNNSAVTPPPPKSQKIMLVIGRKRKADDEITTVSSELHTPPSHASKTPEVDSSLSAEPPKPTIPVVATIGDKRPNDTALNETSDSTKGSNPAPPPTTNTAQENEPPKRAPRKRRKWLRKGEVDPDDPKAVAEQRARHALIDAALEALDQQEQMLLDNTHPQLLALWDEVERRRDIQLAYNKYHEECELRELDRLYLQELGQIRCQFRQDCEDLAALMTFENRRVVSRLDAERVYHDRGKPFTKRMYTNMPTLKEGRGSGGWTVPTKRLLSKGTRRKTLVRVGDHIRQRADVSLTPRMATMKEAQSDLIRLGLREAPPESSSEEEDEESEEDEIEQLEPEPEAVEPLPPLPPPPKSVQPRARAPSPSPPAIPLVKAAPVPRKTSRRAPPAPTPIPHPVELEPRNEPIAFSHPPPPPHAPLRRMDILDPYSRDRPPPLDPRPPPPLDPRERPPPPQLGDLRDPRPPPLVDPRDRPPPPLNDPRDRPPPPPLGADPRDRLPPHPYDRAGPPYDRPYPHPPPMDPHGRPPPLPSASRPPPRYDDRGDWWGPRDRHVGPGPGGYIPPPPMPQTATAPLSAHPPPQPQTATPAGYWARPPPNDEWGDYHYYDRRGYPGGGPPPPAFAGSRP